MNPVNSFTQYASSLGDFGGTKRSSSDAVLGPGIILKMHNLNDLSRPENQTKSAIETYIEQFKSYKTGMRISGVKVNTGYNKSNKAIRVIGNLKQILIDRTNKTVRVFIYDPNNSESFEIYADTIETINESSIKTFDEFIVKN